MIAAKPQASAEDSSMLSFIPKGMPRSIAEYLVASIPGALLLFAFFVASEAVVAFVDPNLAITFIPVICVVPILAGAVSTLILEKVRSKPLTFKRGALIGALAGLDGALISAILLAILSLALHKEPFGTMLTGALVYLVLLVVVVLDAVLGALGGVIVVKFTRDS
ncbi:Uncharacterised protein [uncultured archaeon]|nr:Uncharacterised protein [uncultured archaeon]